MNDKVDPKDYLRKMVDHTVSGDMEAAEADFNSYLIPKTRKQVLGIDLSDVQQQPSDTEVNTEDNNTETEVTEE